jgi:hypothetical protein
MVIKGEIVEAKAHVDCPYCSKVCEFDYEEILKSKEDIVYLKFPCCGVVRQMTKNPPIGLSSHQYFSVTFSYPLITEVEQV